MLTYCISDGIHVGKRKRQSFSNWFLWVNGDLVNLVLLRELRIDPIIKGKLMPILKLDSVRNKDRQTRCGITGTNKFSECSEHTWSN